MQRFRILYFRESVLEKAEEVDVRDVLEAIEQASGKPPYLKVEVWSERGRVAEIGTSPAAHTTLVEAMSGTGTQSEPNASAARARP
jgi:hypothetical protein